MDNTTWGTHRFLTSNTIFLLKWLSIGTSTQGVAPRDAPVPGWAGVQLPVKANTVKLPCLSQPHVWTLLSRQCPTKAQLKVCINLHKNPTEFQVRNTSCRTYSDCLCHHRSGLNTTEIFHCNDITGWQDTISNPVMIFLVEFIYIEYISSISFCLKQNKDNERVFSKAASPTQVKW